LNWHLAPPTLNMWANWYMSQWDSYIQYNMYALNHPLILSLYDPIMVFKQPNDKSYARFRELNQLIDLSLLDIATLQYCPRALIASSMYVLLAYHFGQATKEDIVLQFGQGSGFLNAEFPFNDLFGNYLTTCFGFNLSELLPTIQYISSFMALPFNYDIPATRKKSEDIQVLKDHYLYRNTLRNF